MREIYSDGKRDSDVEDASIAATYLMLAEADEGFESCWLDYLDPDMLAESMVLPN